MAFIPDKLKMLSETFIRIDEKLGITKFIQYTLFIVVIICVFNFSSIVESIMKIQQQIEKREHEKRLLLRDDLMIELKPLLVELRSGIGASRLLYFEYHNSTENFVGIPFKYANLVLTNQVYGCPGYDPGKYKDINSGLISGIYTDLRKQEIIVNKGDVTFNSKYPGTYELFASSEEGSIQQVYVNIPGVNSPIGMIVLEWIDDGAKTSSEWEEIVDKIEHYIPRINALISKYTP